MRKINIDDIKFGQKFYIFDGYTDLVYFKIELPPDIVSGRAFIEMRKNGEMTVIRETEIEYFWVED